MEKITCNLQNCYGIKELHHEFDFAETNAIWMPLESIEEKR